MKRRAFGLALLGLVVAAGCGPSCNCQGVQPQPEPVTIYVVRHAEKEIVDEVASDMEKKDPPLSRAGQLRALGLPDDIPVAELDAVYLTNFRRSHQTAAGVLAVTGLEPIIYPPKDTAGLVARLRRHAGGQVLVVGHSNTVPALLDALGVPERVEVSEDQYGDLWVVTLPAAGPATLELARYGEKPPRSESLGSAVPGRSP